LLLAGGKVDVSLVIDGFEMSGWGHLNGEAVLVALKDETLNDVMWEIAEERERRRKCIDADELREWLNAWVATLSGGYVRADEERLAFLMVLRLIDDLQDR
jgi:hypothetical protein